VTSDSGYILPLLLTCSLFAIGEFLVVVVCAAARPFVLVNGGSSSSAYMNMNGLEELVITQNLLCL